MFPLGSAILNESGIPWSFRSLPAARLYEYMENGLTNFALLVDSPLLTWCCLKSEKPFISVEVRLYYFDGVEPIERIEDLAEKKVIVMNGYRYGQFGEFISDPNNNVTRYTVDSHDAVFAMLEAGRAKYALEYEWPAIETLEKQKIKGLKYNVLASVDMHIFLNRTYPNAEKIMRGLEEVTSRLNLEEILNLPRD